jgi:hypothetical protein
MKKFSIVFVVLFIGCVICDEDDGSDKSEEVEEELPDHKFITNNNPFKSGPRKGEPRITYSLEVAPYTFTRKSEKGGVAWFACNGCKAASKKWNLAKTKKNIGNNEEVTYELLRVPDEHDCMPSSVNHLVKQFRKRLYACIKQNPTMSINRIYKKQ